MTGESTSFTHAPVMIEEIGGLLGVVPPGIVVDATVGARSADVVNDQVFGAAIGSGRPS